MSCFLPVREHRQDRLAVRSHIHPPHLKAVLRWMLSGTICRRTGEELVLRVKGSRL